MAAGERQRFGAAGERLVARWYEHAGYEVVDRNWRCPQGELDLVCRRGHHLVICEVKSRRSERLGTGPEAVNRAKQLRLRRLAARWMAQHRPDGGRWASVRFDVAVVTRAGVEMIEDALP